MGRHGSETEPRPWSISHAPVQIDHKTPLLSVLLLTATRLISNRAVLMRLIYVTATR